MPSPELSIVMPCLNESETIGRCVQKALSALAELRIQGEVIVADNGSDDGSQEIATRLGARVVHIRERGYGSALRGGIAAAQGEFVIMGDADDSYDFGAIAPFLAKLREGYDLVMGDRFAGGIAKGAMPFLHRWLGNPGLSFLGRLFFGAAVRDFHCGMRGFRRASLETLNLQATGMEFASEMVIRMTLFGLRVTEVPTTLVQDGRSRPPHLRTWRDGWRHLRFMLLCTPRWIFVIPGLALLAVGLAGVGRLWLGPVALRPDVMIDVHTMLLAALAAMLGYQALLFGAISSVHGALSGLHPASPVIKAVRRWFTLEAGIGAGVLLVLAGLAFVVAAFLGWEGRDFGPLAPQMTMRSVIPGAMLVEMGAQTVFSTFLLHLIQMRSTAVPAVSAAPSRPALAS